jgi:hypothetical protein
VTVPFVPRGDICVKVARKNIIQNMRKMFDLPSNPHHHLMKVL